MASSAYHLQCMHAKLLDTGT